METPQRTRSVAGGQAAFHEAPDRREKTVRAEKSRPRPGHRTEMWIGLRSGRCWPKKFSGNLERPRTLLPTLWLVPFVAACAMLGTWWRTSWWEEGVGGPGKSTLAGRGSLTLGLTSPSLAKADQTVLNWQVQPFGTGCLVSNVLKST